MEFVTILFGINFGGLNFYLFIELKVGGSTILSS